jgi:hypothetical protein
MRDNSSSYERAVALFEAMLAAPVEHHCQKPADIAHRLARAKSTSYRFLAEAEATGLLQRDLNQSYRRGLQARRIGFAAAGFGALADVAEPTLTELREALRMTTLFAVVRDQHLTVGPFSIGRGVGYIRPDLSYRLTAPIGLSTLTSLTLLPEQIEDTTLFARCLVVDRNPRGACVLAVCAAQPLSGPLSSVDEALTALEGRIPTGRAE